MVIPKSSIAAVVEFMTVELVKIEAHRWEALFSSRHRTYRVVWFSGCAVSNLDM
jgi:hypothetical protein